MMLLLFLVCSDRQINKKEGNESRGVKKGRSPRVGLEQRREWRLAVDERKRRKARKSWDEEFETWEQSKGKEYLPRRARRGEVSPREGAFLERTCHVCLGCHDLHEFEWPWLKAMTSGDPGPGISTRPRPMAEHADLQKIRRRDFA